MAKKKHKQITPMIPPMVAMLMEPQLEIQQRMALQSFSGGWATGEQFLEIIDCVSFLYMGAEAKGNQNLIDFCAEVITKLDPIRERFDQTGNWTAQEDELETLQKLIDVSQAFWGTASAGFFLEMRKIFKQSITT